MLQQASAATVFSTGVVVDSQDRLHLIWTTEQGRTAFSVLETESVRGGKDEANWVNPATRRKGAHVIAPSRSWAGDICLAPDGQVWLTWTTTVADEPEVTVHLGTVRDAPGLKTVTCRSNGSRRNTVWARIRPRSGGGNRVGEEGDQTRQADYHKSLYEMLMRKHAIDTGMYVIDANQGHSGNAWFPGLSLVVTRQLVDEHLPTEGMPEPFVMHRNSLMEQLARHACLRDCCRHSLCGR